MLIADRGYALPGPVVQQMSEKQPGSRHLLGQFADELLFGAEVPVAPDQSQVGKQRAAADFLFRRYLKGPTLALGEQPRHGQFPLDARAIELAGGLDFEQAM